MPYENADCIFDIAKILHAAFTSVTNPSFTHDFTAKDQTSMKNATLRILEHTPEAKTPPVVNATIHELLTNNRGILSQETRNSFFNICSEYANFAFQAIQQSQGLRDYLYEVEKFVDRFKTMKVTNDDFELPTSSDEDSDKENRSWLEQMNSDLQAIKKSHEKYTTTSL